jgi:SAM-dependent methyltransferase
VLDVGCGTGDITERLDREVEATVVALDRSPRMAELALARGVPALVGDIQTLPFRTGSLDCVLANRVLYHVPDLSLGLHEIARVLCSGGALVVVTYGIDHLTELWGLVGESPIASSASTDVGLALLREHFVQVERRELTGTARFPTADAIRGYLAAYGKFTATDLPARLGDVETPFEASYHHLVYIARKGQKADDFPVVRPSYLHG